MSARAQDLDHFQYRRGISQNSDPITRAYRNEYSSIQADTTEADTTSYASQFPDPKKVLYKSLMIPGWGQIVNKQIWKVPIVYGMLAGLTWYSIFLNQKYHDYRAAYYNRTHSDFRFGQTPTYIPSNVDERLLKKNRNYFRNRRDFVYISIGLAYGLNAIDAYVYAHLRSFNVSDDLSMRTTIKPTLVNSSPGLAVSLKLFNR